MSKRVLVTGVTGFAGKYLVPRLLETGYEVVGLVRQGNDEHVPPGVEDVRVADLRDAESVREAVVGLSPTHVVHLAAISFVAHEDPAEIYLSNVVGTRNLLAALRDIDRQLAAVLLASSANIYGNTDKGVIAETEPFNPANDYAISKVAMELVAKTFNSLPTIICRPFNYTGVGQSPKFLVPKIVEHFRLRAPKIELGNIDVMRDFSDVRDVVEYMCRLLESPSAIGNTFNICSGIPYSARDVLDRCAAITGHHLEVEVNPSFVRQNEVKTLVGDPSRLHAEVGIVGERDFTSSLRWMLS